MAIPSQSQYSVPALLSSAQKDLAETFQSIFGKTDHPYSKLTNLQQKGAIRSLSQTTNATPSCVVITVAAVDHAGTANFTSSCRASSKVAAKFSASMEVLNQVIQHLQDHPPCSLTAPVRTVLKGAEFDMQTRDRADLQTLEKIHTDYIRELFFQRKAIGVLSIDVEKHDHAPRVVLEVGVSHVALADLLRIDERGTNRSPRQQSVEVNHFVNSTYLHLHNITPGYDQRENFDFGTSVLVPDSELVALINDKIAQCQAEYHTLYLVGHAVAGDVKWLEEIGVNVPTNMACCDVGHIYRSVNNPVPYQLYKMQKMLYGLGIEHAHLHNAGNDCYYNLAILGVMLVGFAHGWPDSFINVAAHTYVK